MICYHTTDAADAILRHGFRDATGSYLFATIQLTGVWLGDSPMDVNEGAKGDQVLRVEFPDDVDLGDFEVVEEQKPYREWCVPAALINTHATVTLMSDEDDDDSIHCARCNGPFPPLDDPEFRRWACTEANGELAFICGDCITPEERQG